MAQGQEQNEGLGVGTGGENSALPLRRSNRVRKRPSDNLDAADTEIRLSSAPQPAGGVRRNPKRKAAPEAFDVPENLLEASLGPWKENEQAEWASWIELESEPDFFTAILGLLGVKGARIGELVSAADESLADLPSPVYGLVFLDEFFAEQESNPAESSQEVWFANQTTTNACATIALLNIVMNAEGLALGEKLRKFKQDSMDLSPPLRGNMITKSTWIRVAHNSFARRLDLLDAALALQNEVDGWEKLVRKSKTAKLKKGKGKRAKEDKAGGSTAYHFIGFVPVGQRVWQLDGLTPTPVCIGEIGEGRHWASVVWPVLHLRMARYEQQHLAFNLLALCGDGVSELRHTLAANIRGLEQLAAGFASIPEWQPTVDPDAISSSADERLHTYQLSTEDVRTAADDKIGALSENSGLANMTVEEALERWETLLKEQAGVRSRLKEGLLGPAQIIDRTKDYTPAIHEWVKKLAEQKALKGLYDEVALQNASPV